MIRTGNDALHALVWGPGMLLLLLGTGVLLSIRCGFPQFLHFGQVLTRTAGRLFHARNNADKGFSPLEALSTALAGTVGTGNIAGVTGAILLGGPGAVFWMWVAAFFGMCTKFAEIALAVRFRIRDAEGNPFGGPMVTIERGLGPRFRPLAAAFALLGGLASFGIGNLAQSCEIAASARLLFNAPPLLTGTLLAGFVGAVLLGGRQRIGRMTALLVPLMAGLYVLTAVPVLLLHLPELPGLFRRILRCAFTLRASCGGAMGWTLRDALRQGLARGVFSNEAGLGSAPIAYASASCDRPGEQAVWGIFEVFLDSFVICTLTALTVLLSGIAEDAPERFPSAGAAAAEAFRRLLPPFLGGWLIPLCLLLFALSSIVGWAWYGEVCWRWLFRGRKAAVTVFRLVFALLCLAGAGGSGALMWEIADTLNGLMALPNLVSLLLLSGTAAKISKELFPAQS